MTKATEQGAAESAALSLADSRTLNFFMQNQLMERCASMRRVLIQVAVILYKDSLTSILIHEAGSDGKSDANMQAKAASNTAEWPVKSWKHFHSRSHPARGDQAALPTPKDRQSSHPILGEGDLDY